MKHLSKQEFIQKAKAILGEGYDFKKTTYMASNIKTIITCKEHGDFLVTPNNVLNRFSGCPLCAGEKARKSLAYTNQEFIKKAKKIHGDKYDYSLVHYINNYTKIKIICPKHGIFEQLPYNHLRGNGCPHCKKNPRV